MTLKHWLILTTVVVVLVGGYLSAAHLSGGAFPTCGLPLGGERAELRESTLSFWEDIQFKDFDTAATYHSPEAQATVDIAFIIERLFMIKPESLDIMDYEVMWVDIDSTGLRARVMCRVKVKHLLNGRIKSVEEIIYYTRARVDAPWYMNLETSLRRSERRDKDKKI